MNSYKLLITAVIFAFCFVLGCDDTVSPKMDSAVITGFDVRECACCGGLMINFENNPASYQGKFYLISNNPQDLLKRDTFNFPIYVKVNWEKSAIICVDEIINIKKIEIIE